MLKQIANDFSVPTPLTCIQLQESGILDGITTSLTWNCLSNYSILIAHSKRREITEKQLNEETREFIRHCGGSGCSISINSEGYNDSIKSGFAVSIPAPSFDQLNRILPEKIYIKTRWGFTDWHSKNILSPDSSIQSCVRHLLKVRKIIIEKPILIYYGTSDPYYYSMADNYAQAAAEILLQLHNDSIIKQPV